MLGISGGNFLCQFSPGRIGLRSLSPKTSPHSSLQETKFITWNSLWEHPRLTKPYQRGGFHRGSFRKGVRTLIGVFGGGVWGRVQAGGGGGGYIRPCPQNG